MQEIKTLEGANKTQISNLQKYYHFTISLKSNLCQSNISTAIMYKRIKGNHYVYPRDYLPTLPKNFFD